MLSAMRLKTKMSVLLLVPVVVILTLIIGIAYNSSKTALEKQVEQKLTALAQQYSGDVLRWLMPAEDIVKNTANTTGLDQKPSETLQQMLGDWGSLHKNISSVYIAWENGKFIDSTNWIPPADYKSTEKDWYKVATQGTGVEYSNVYPDTETKELVVTIGHKITANGKTNGVVATDIKLTEVKEMVNQIKVGTSGYAFLLDGEGNFLAHPQFTFSDNVKTVYNGTMKEFGTQVLSGTPQLTRQSVVGVEQYLASVPLGKTKMVLIVAIPVKEALADANSLAMKILGVGLLGLLLLTAIIFFIAVSAVKTVQTLESAVEQVANNDLSADYSFLLNNKNKDEFASLMHNFYKMIENLKMIVAKVVDSSQQVASSSEELTASAEESTQAVVQVATAIGHMAKGTENQVKAVDTTTNVVKQLSDGLEQIAVAAKEVSGIAQETVQATEVGRDGIENAVNQINQLGASTVEMESAMLELSKDSKEISEIVNLISSIAGQTNLLALNAAIEAARAGEYGRGFAVVADEVRKLAEQSNEAALRIGKLIGQNQLNMNKTTAAIRHSGEGIKLGVQVVNEAGSKFSDIASAVSELNTHIQQISAAIEQVADNNQHIINAVGEVGKISSDNAAEAQSVSAATEEQAATMEQITSSSESLARLAQELQNTVTTFKL